MAETERIWFGFDEKLAKFTYSIELPILLVLASSHKTLTFDLKVIIICLHRWKAHLNSATIRFA